MKKISPKDIKKRVVALRTDLNLSQTDLAEKIGMSRSGYWQAESLSHMKGANVFTLEQIIRLKYELKTTYDYIIEGIGGAGKKEVAVSEAAEPTPVYKTEDAKALELENSFLKDKLKSQEEFIEILRENITLLKGKK